MEKAVKEYGHVRPTKVITVILRLEKAASQIKHVSHTT